MPLPPRAFWSLNEAAARWGCTPSDIVGWGCYDKVEIVAAIPPVQTGQIFVAGIAVVPPHELLPYFPRDGVSAEQVVIRRVKPEGSAGWQIITDPAPGLVLPRTALAITGKECERFEREHEIRKTAVVPATQSTWDWESFMVAQFKRVHDHGLPASQNEWIREAQDWFARRSLTGEHPDERTVRRKLQPIWKALREDETTDEAA